MLLNIGRLAFFRSERIAHELIYLSAFKVLEQDGLHGLLTMLRGEIIAHKPAVLVIDGLVTAEQIAPSELELKKFVHELQTQAATGDCTMFLLTSAGDAAASPEHTMVDGMIELADRQYDWRAEREITVRKFRGSGYLRGRHSMRIDDEIAFPSFPVSRRCGEARPGETCGWPRVPLGVAGLDEMPGGGVAQASTTSGAGGLPGRARRCLARISWGCAAGPAEPGLLVGFYELPNSLAGLGRDAGAGADHRPARRPGWRFRGSRRHEDHMDRIALELMANVRGRRRACGGRCWTGCWGFRALTPYPERLPAFVRALCNGLRGLDVTSLFTMEVPELVGSVVRAPATSLTPIATTCCCCAMSS